MTDRAPGFDPQHPSDALQRADEAEREYMEGGDGDSEERLHVVLTEALVNDDYLAGALRADDLAQASGTLPWDEYVRYVRVIRRTILEGTDHGNA